MRGVNTCMKERKAKEGKESIAKHSVAKDGQSEAATTDQVRASSKQAGKQPLAEPGQAAALNQGLRDWRSFGG